jgi:hypothetical protein
MEKPILESLLIEHKSWRAVARHLGKSQGSIRYWVRKHDLDTNKERSKFRLTQDNAICTQCKITKPMTEFYKKNKTNANSFCKDCFLAYIKVRWHDKKKEAIEFMGGKCIDCKGVFHPAVYQFHHLDPKTKEFSWGKGRLKNFEKIKKELAKCVLLCANCHVIRHSNYL